jgi:acetyl esterase/lipase
VSSVSGNPRDVLTRPTPPPDGVVRYGPHRDQIADVYLPGDGPVRPLVVFVHGGFWQALHDRAHTRPACADLAARGHPVATVEYRRLGSGGGWPETFEDVEAALATVPLRVNDLLRASGRDPAPVRVAVMGHSAGGQLALWAARRAGPARVRGVVALAPVADLVAAHRLRLEEGVVAQLLGGGPRERPERYAAVDPAVNLPVGVPVVVVHGEADRIVPYPIGRDFATASVAAGDDTVLYSLPGIEHYGVIDPLSPAWSAIVRGLASVCDGARG